MKTTGYEVSFHYRLGKDESFSREFNQFVTADYFSLFSFAREDPGMIRIKDMESNAGLFAGVQSNGYVLVYNASNYQPSSSDVINPDFWASRGFGGSPRFRSGPCLFRTCAYCSSATQSTGTACVTDCLCDKEYPSKGENIAISSSGRCLAVTNTFQNEVDLLSFNFTDPSRLNRSYNRDLNGIELANKRPELLASDNNNNILIVKREDSSAVFCGITEDSDESITSQESVCRFHECYEFCHPSLQNATQVDVMKKSGDVVITNADQHRIYLVNKKGLELGHYPEPSHTEPDCELVKVVTHPDKPVVALLYDTPAVVIVRWSQGRFDEIARFDQSSVPDMESPVDASFSYDDSQESLFVAFAGDSKQIARFQAFPEVNGGSPIQPSLPTGLISVAGNEPVSLNESTCLNQTISMDRAQCQFSTDNDEFQCKKRDDGINNPNLPIGLGTAGAVLISTGLTATVIAIVLYYIKKHRSGKTGSVDIEMTVTI